MAAFSELDTRRRLMSEYIRRSSTGSSGRIEVVISFSRDKRVKTSSGGFRTESTVTLPPQNFGLMPFKRRQTDEAGLTAPSLGRDRVTVSQYLLIAEIDADVKDDDYFEWDVEEHLKPGIYKVEYVATRHHDRKLVGIQYHALRS